ncbi:MAG: hypothetical protein QOH90_1386, partial [Actinomycetota bacterium]|nr:hypothetical protein [Actinomycetota bacterium]
FEVCKPERIAMPEWIPEDLPLPKGTYASEEEMSVSGYRRAFLIWPPGFTNDEVRHFVFDEWPEAGFRIGRQDSEYGEVEAELHHSPAEGAFKILTTACHPRYRVLYLIYAPTGPNPR